MAKTDKNLDLHPIEEQVDMYNDEAMMTPRPGDEVFNPEAEEERRGAAYFKLVDHHINTLILNNVKKGIYELILPTFLEGRKKIDIIEDPSSFSGKHKRSLTQSFMSLFQKNNMAKVHPLMPALTTDLSRKTSLPSEDQIQKQENKDECTTARNLIGYIPLHINAQDSIAQVIACIHQAQDKLIENISLLKQNKRIDMFWNKIEPDPGSGAYEDDREKIREAARLGTISNPKLISILKNVADEFKKLDTTAIEGYEISTQVNLEKEVAEVVKQTYQEFSQSFLGNYIVKLTKLQENKWKLEFAGRSDAEVKKLLEVDNKALDEVFDNLPEVDAAKATALKNIDFSKKSKLSTLFIAPSDDTFQNFLKSVKQKIDNSIFADRDELHKRSSSEIFRKS